MARHIILSLGLVCIISICLIEAARPNKRGKRPKLPKAKGNLQQDVDDLQDELAEVRELIKAAGPDGGGQCGSNKVHFFFHDQNHDDHEHEEDDMHVHVDLHLNNAGGHFPYGDGDTHDHSHSAVCKFDKGYAYISQNVKERFASFKFSFSEISAESLAVHVHENGDLRNGCPGLGDHYDPIIANEDVGNIGTITPATDNIKEVWFKKTKLSLIGAHSILGRSIVGHAGDKLICCVIGRAADDHDHDHDSHSGHNHEGHSFHGHAADSHEGHDHASHDGHEHHGHGHGHGDHVH